MKVICPQCGETFEFSLRQREGMKVTCPKCRRMVFSKYKPVELVMFALSLILLVFVFLSNKLSNMQLLLLLGVFVALEYGIRVGYIWIHNLMNRKK